MWYELVLEPDDNGTWIVSAPAFPEVVSFGETQEDACRHGRDAILEAIAARIADRESIPLPLKDTPGRGWVVEIPAMAYLKSALYMLLRERNMTRADLMRALGCQREHVDRLFRLDHNSQLSSIEEAFQALDVHLRIDVPFPKAA